ncbi:MAG TPA: tRNA (guanosine(37)-N1)-methyltransferase TrmD [Bacilli bacterium]|nr:tRNA (guanosine(37)-N1)-methyltransferase TrmD [Bacilli bacterium]
MKITILTLFPEMFSGFVSQSIIKRALAKDVVDIQIVNIRDYTKDKYGRVDTPPIGGGAGLIMKAQPIVDALLANNLTKPHKIMLSPRGQTFNQNRAKQLATLSDIVLICGHYEGIDERVNNYVDEQISIGEFILTGGEIGAMAIADAIIRLIPEAIEATSLDVESFDDGLLEYPQYTEPYDFEGYKVPDILYSGNHEAIAKWRHLLRLVITREARPDLFAQYNLTKLDKKLINQYDSDETPTWLSDAIAKGIKFMKGH